MFNFLVVSNTDAWEGFVYELIGRSRFGEYTSEIIRNRFSHFSSKAIEELKSFPTLFTYEGNDEKVKIGYIRSISTGKDSVRIEYEFESFVPEFTFSALASQINKLNIGKYEMSRTHWAVKDGDLFEILSQAGLIDKTVLHSPQLLGRVEDLRFKVALSFPGEKRDYVEEIANELKRSLPRGSVFYDKDFTSQLARPNLDTLLQKIYLENSDLDVVFLSSEYESKEWCGLEWRAIREHIKHKKYNSIMFMKFDDAQIPGVFSTDGYVDLNRWTSKEASQFIIERIRLNEADVKKESAEKVVGTNFLVAAEQIEVRLRSIDMRIIDELFEMKGGYVLDFTNATFVDFIKDFDVKADDAVFDEGQSKANRLRDYLRRASQKEVIKILQGLWEYREVILRHRDNEHLPNQRELFSRLLKRLGGNYVE